MTKRRTPIPKEEAEHRLLHRYLYADVNHLTLVFEEMLRRLVGAEDGEAIRDSLRPLRITLRDMVGINMNPQPLADITQPATPILWKQAIERPRHRQFGTFGNDVNDPYVILAHLVALDDDACASTYDSQVPCLWPRMDRELATAPRTARRYYLFSVWEMLQRMPDTPPYDRLRLSHHQLTIVHHCTDVFEIPMTCLVPLLEWLPAVLLPLIQRLAGPPCRADVIEAILREQDSGASCPLTRSR